MSISMKKGAIKILTFFVYFWIGLILILNIIAIIGFFIAGGFWGGLRAIQDTYSPFNLSNAIVEFISLAPAIFAYKYLEKLKDDVFMSEVVTKYGETDTTSK